MYSVPMAIVDFIPTFLYLFAALTVFKYLKANVKAFASYIYVVGAVMVFGAAFFKALYKLISALKLGEVAWMANMFMPVQSFGFLICGIGMLICVLSAKKVYSIPTMALVGIMVGGVALSDISLAIIAGKRKKKAAIPFFILAFVFCLMMGYLSSKDFTQSYMNWVAELVNTVAQLMLFIGAKKLAK